MEEKVSDVMLCGMEYMYQLYFTYNYDMNDTIKI